MNGVGTATSGAWLPGVPHCNPATVDQLLVVLGTFAFCACSAMIPVLHAEAYLVAASLLAPPELRWPLIIAAASGQMLGKVGMYYAGRGVRLIPGERMQRRIRLATERYRDTAQLGGGLVFLSAASGIPPFYLISVAAGTLTFPIMPFIILGFLGRFLRFTAAVFLPHLGRA
jgi:membrane protein YqaA with SNARE-associated domain